MKKWLIMISIIAVSALAAIQITSYINDYVSSPQFCASCHEMRRNYDNYIINYSISNSPMISAHRSHGITCIQCHSGQNYAQTKGLLIKATVLYKMNPLLNYVFKANYSFNQTVNTSQFKEELKPNCIKCHNTSVVNVTQFNHSDITNTTTCWFCHSMHTPLTTTNFSIKIGIGAHRNKTCADCHGTSSDIQIPACMKCHTPHEKGAQWDNRVCLACHSDPHQPVRNATFAPGIPKERCAVCHPTVYYTLKVYNSKHNDLPTCVSCHPSHGAKKRCFECHINHPQKHNVVCSGCHLKVSGCTTCHTNPHAPKSGVTYFPLTK